MTFRRRSGLGIGVFMGALILLIAFIIFSFVEDGRSTWLVFMLSSMGLSIMFVQPRIELDFSRNRFRTFYLSLLARESDFKELPKLDRIQVRDITTPGGRAGSRYSWGDTYSYEIFLMTVANEKWWVFRRRRRGDILLR